MFANQGNQIVRPAQTRSGSYQKNLQESYSPFKRQRVLRQRNYGRNQAQRLLGL